MTAIVALYVLVCAAVVGWCRTVSWREPKRGVWQFSNIILTGPPVILVSARAARVQAMEPGLRACGYRFVEKEMDTLASRWVRPLPLWAVHKAYVAFDRWRWVSLRWLYNRGLLSAATDYFAPVHWYEYRPFKLGRNHVDHD